jgi:hypothetical protein
VHVSTDIAVPLLPNAIDGTVIDARRCISMLCSLGALTHDVQSCGRLRHRTNLLLAQWAPEFWAWKRLQFKFMTLVNSSYVTSEKNVHHSAMNGLAACMRSQKYFPQDTQHVACRAPSSHATVAVKVL